jgi:hypothetical protein
MRIIKGFLVVVGAAACVLVAAGIWTIQAVNDFRTIPID